MFADSNVILDIATSDPRWSGWSSDQLSHWLNAGCVRINPIINGEIAFACERIEEVDELLPPERFHERPIPREAAFLASRAHADYRSRGGQAYPGLNLITP